MKRLGEILAPALRRTAARQSPFKWLAGTWPAIVGRRLAAHTRPSKLAEGVLDVAVNGRDWRNELEGVSVEFCSRVNEAWGGALVREIRFWVDRIGTPRLPHELDNEHMPFVRSRRSSPSDRRPAGPHGGKAGGR
ncbi:MAG: DUF721 domain-containing protein [Candidatus Acidiferrales bacterium]